MKLAPLKHCPSCSRDRSAIFFHKRAVCSDCFTAPKRLEIGPEPVRKPKKRAKQPRVVGKRWRLAEAWRLALAKAARNRELGLEGRENTRADHIHRRRCRRCHHIRLACDMIWYGASPDHRGDTCRWCSSTPNAHYPPSARRAIKLKRWAAARRRQQKAVLNSNE